MGLVKEAMIYDPQSMTFGAALSELKDGKRVARAGWNGKGMWLLLVQGHEWMVGNYNVYSLAPFIGMKTADDKFVPWLCSQTDMLAEDWQVVP